MKLEKLTSEQERKIAEVKDFWLSYIFSCKNNQINKEAVKIGIEWMYQLSGHKAPVMIYVDSPMGCQYAVAYLKKIALRFPRINWDSVGDSVRASVRD